jgi:hypothetical protein
LTLRTLIVAGADVAAADGDGKTPRAVTERLAEALGARTKGEDGRAAETAVARDDGPDANTVDQIVEILELFELVCLALPARVDFLGGRSRAARE